MSVRIKLQTQDGDSSVLQTTGILLHTTWCQPRP